MTEAEFKKVKEAIIQADLDLKGEVVAEELIGLGIPVESIIPRRLGTSKRGYRKDVLDIEYRMDEADRQRSVIALSREGIYDQLPEGLFHQPREKNKTVEDDINEVKEFRQQEAEARMVFLPLESEFFNINLQIEKEERKQLKGFSDDTNRQHFLAFWSLPDFFSSAQLNVLFQILPYTHKIRGDFELMSKSYELLLNYPVSFNLGMRQSKFPIELNNRLGEEILGNTFILGKNYTYFQPIIQIIISNVLTEETGCFRVDGKNYQIIDILNTFFIPSGFEYQLTLKLRDSDGFFLQQEFSPSFLGINTYI